MSTSARVVIGANFGDEGKGLLTDYFAAQGADWVVRFNGGAQAGHTVQTPQGQRHVFSHFGSGSFCGVPSFLSRHFVCNPLLFHKEWALLQAAGLSPRVSVDARAAVSTPYDMLLNQLVEDRRGSARHGSCGVGFGETLQRNLHAAFRLQVEDLAQPATLADKLDAIRRHYVPQRLLELGLGDIDASQSALLQSDGLLQHYLEDAQLFLACCNVVADAGLLGRADRLVFEGAQGLLLDQQHRWFPHVTRSSTGLRNVLDIAAEAGISTLEACYVSRAYLTRHGAGPLPGELPAPPYPGIEDQTNRPNTYQGALRFGLLDLDLLCAEVLADSRLAVGSGISVNTSLAFTCLDQVDTAQLRHIAEGSERQSSMAAVLDSALQATGARQAYLSYGPSRSTISCHQATAIGCSDKHATGHFNTLGIDPAAVIA